jgi:hypothetical protein
MWHRTRWLYVGLTLCLGWAGCRGIDIFPPIEPPKPSPTPVGPPVTNPTPEPKPTPTPLPHPGADCVPGTVNCGCWDQRPGEGRMWPCCEDGGATRVGNKALCPTPKPPTPPPTPAPKPPRQQWCDAQGRPRHDPPLPEECSTPVERVLWEIGRGSWLPRCSADGTGPRTVTTGRYGQFTCPDGQKLSGMYGCAPADEVFGCTPTSCADLNGNKIDCASGHVIYTVEDGWQGNICRHCPAPGPTPTPTPTPSPGDTGGPINPRVLLRVGVATHGCRALKDGQTKIVVNATPRIPRYQGDAKGDEQPREFNDERGPVCSQAGTGWSGYDEMEHTTGSPYLCHSVLPPGTYRFRACPQPDLPVVDRDFPGLCGETKVVIHSHGVVECLENCAIYFHNGECR